MVVLQSGPARSRMMMIASHFAAIVETRQGREANERKHVYAGKKEKNKAESRTRSDRIKEGKNCQVQQHLHPIDRRWKCCLLLARCVALQTLPRRLADVNGRSNNPGRAHETDGSKCHRQHLHASIHPSIHPSACQSVLVDDVCGC